MKISLVPVRTLAATAALALLVGCGASGTATTTSTATTPGTTNSSPATTAQQPGDPTVPSQDLPGPIVESSQVAIGHGSFTGGLGPDRTGPRRIATAADLDTYVSGFQGQNGTGAFTDDEVAQAKDALTRGRVLVGALFHSGCFPAAGPELVDVNGSYQMVATFTDPQEANVACYVAVSTVALLSFAPSDIPEGSIPAVGETVPETVSAPETSTNQPTNESTGSDQPTETAIPETTPQTTGPIQTAPTLPGPEVTSTQVALASGSFRGAYSDIEAGPYRITDADQLARFNALVIGVDDKGLIPADQIATAQKDLDQGLVLVGATINSGCFPAGKPTLAQDGDKLALVAMELDPQEGMVNCYVAVGTVAIVSASPQDVPVGSMSSAADLPAAR
ncbi:hypothetical protein D1871_02875 [Nakamurella silvestris]|nr:hypothetical protein D1871_02875 [Nakamurella silvestris]